MNSWVKGFFEGIFVLIVCFFIAVSITGEIRGHDGFVGELQSWGNNSEQSEQIPDDKEQENQVKIEANSIIVN